MKSLLWAVMALCLASPAMAVIELSNSNVGNGTTFLMSVPTETYQLTETITTTQTSVILEFRSSNVTLDLNGFDIIVQGASQVEVVEFDGLSSGCKIIGPGTIQHLGTNLNSRAVEFVSAGTVQSCELFSAAGRVVYISNGGATMESVLIYAEGAGAHAIYRNGGGAVSLVNCTVVAEGGHAYYDRVGSNLSIQNTILATAASGSDPFNSNQTLVTPTFANNALYAPDISPSEALVTATGISWTIPNQMAATCIGGTGWDPFVNWITGNFVDSDWSISSGLEINAGTNTPVTVTVDAAGNARTVNTTVDIGAYELQTAENTGNATRTCDIILASTDAPFGLIEPGTYCIDWTGTWQYDPNASGPIVTSYGQTDGWRYVIPEAGSRVQPLEITGEEVLFWNTSGGTLYLEGWDMIGTSWDDGMVTTDSDSLALVDCGPNLSVNVDGSVAGEDLDYVLIENCSFIPGRNPTEFWTGQTYRAETVLYISGDRGANEIPSSQVCDFDVTNLSISNLYLRALYNQPDNGGQTETYAVDWYCVDGGSMDDYWVTGSTVQDFDSGNITLMQLHSTRNMTITNGRLYGDGGVERMMTIRGNTDVVPGGDTRSANVQVSNLWAHNATTNGNGVTLDADNSSMTHFEVYAGGNYGSTAHVVRLSEQSSACTLEVGLAVAMSDEGNALFLGGNKLWSDLIPQRYNYVSAVTAVGGGVPFSNNQDGAAFWIQSDNAGGSPNNQNAIMEIVNSNFITRKPNAYVWYAEDINAPLSWVVQNNTFAWNGTGYLYFNEEDDAGYTTLAAWESAWTLASGNQVVTDDLVTNLTYDTLGTYSLPETSPGIDFGDATKDWLDLDRDLAGEPRPVGDDIDTGPFEFQGDLPDPTGACCDGVGGCTVVARSTCLGAGSTFLGSGTDCTPNPCGNPGFSESGPINVIINLIFKGNKKQ